MQISKRMAKQIVSKLQAMLPYEVVVLDYSGEVLCSTQERSREELIRIIHIENAAGERRLSRTLCSFGKAVGYIVIYGNQESKDFSLLLNMAKEMAESILAVEFAKVEGNHRQNYQLALRNLLSYHNKTDVVTVQEVLQRNGFDWNLPRTMIYFDLFTQAQDQRITAVRDDTGSITTTGLIYDNFVEYLNVTFSRPFDLVLPSEDRHSVYVFCEDRAADTELSDVQLYNICHQMVERTGENFWGDFRVVIGKRCTCFSDYSGVYEQMKRRMESGLLLFPDEHIIFGRTTILGNVVAFISSHAKASIIQLVVGMVLKDKASQTYISTLRELFQNNMNMNVTAEKLHIHRNTLQYRLKKIEELSGYSVYDIDGALTLRLALLCYNYLEQFPDERVAEPEPGTEGAE